jgi:hypothetical protein
LSTEDDIVANKSKKLSLGYHPRKEILLLLAVLHPQLTSENMSPPRSALPKMTTVDPARKGSEK